MRLALAVVLSSILLMSVFVYIIEVTPHTTVYTGEGMNIGINGGHRVFDDFKLLPLCGRYKVRVEGNLTLITPKGLVRSDYFKTRVRIVEIFGYVPLLKNVTVEFKYELGRLVWYSTIVLLIGGVVAYGLKVLGFG